MYTQHIAVGDIVISKKGHDTNKVFAVVAVLSGDFCLIADGASRKIDKLKTKRCSQLKKLGFSEQLKDKIASRAVVDSDIIEAIKNFPCHKMFF